MSDMAASPDASAPAQASSSVLANWLMAGTALALVGAGALMWIAQGEALFTDGLIAAFLRCF